MYKPGDVVEVVDYPCETWNGLAMVVKADAWRSENLIIIKQIPFPREAGGVGGFSEKHIRLVVDGSELDRG